MVRAIEGYPSETMVHLFQQAPNVYVRHGSRGPREGVEHLHIAYEVYLQPPVDHRPTRSIVRATRPSRRRTRYTRLDSWPITTSQQQKPIEPSLTTSPEVSWVGPSMNSPVPHGGRKSLTFLVEQQYKSPTSTSGSYRLPLLIKQRSWSG